MKEFAGQFRQRRRTAKIASCRDYRLWLSLNRMDVGFHLRPSLHLYMFAHKTISSTQIDPLEGLSIDSACSWVRRGLVKS